MRHESKWICCPQCGSKTKVKVYEETVLVKFPLYCPKCKKEFMVNVVKLKMVLSDEPDAYSTEPADPPAGEKQALFFYIVIQSQWRPLSGVRQ